MAQTNEGHGFGATGAVNEAAGLTVDFRLAADDGHYLRSVSDSIPLRKS